MEPVDNESDVQREPGAQSLSPGETPSAEASERSTPNSQIEGSQSQPERKLLHILWFIHLAQLRFRHYVDTYGLYILARTETGTGIGNKVVV